MTAIGKRTQVGLDNRARIHAALPATVTELRHSTKLPLVTIQGHLRTLIDLRAAYRAEDVKRGVNMVPYYNKTPLTLADAYAAVAARRLPAIPDTPYKTRWQSAEEIQETLRRRDARGDELGVAQ